MYDHAKYFDCVNMWHSLEHTLFGFEHAGFRVRHSRYHKIEYNVVGCLKAL